MMNSNLNPIAGRNNHRRRGSALMVALALLMILAVFAALFLTSSRFDQDASTANIDYIRMDLYAEGMAQYIQSCMVASLWGFDNIPLNYDGLAPRPGAIPARVAPDAPYDYPGVRLVPTAGGTGDGNLDPIESTDIRTDPLLSAASADIAYYPDFWLGSPSRDVTNTYWTRSAFAPYGVLDSIPDLKGSVAVPRRCVRNNDTDRTATRLGNSVGANVDTPWLFWKSLGNGLYIRAAVRVEDTSNRVNVNVARQPVNAANVVSLPDVYRGYPAPAAFAATAYGDEVLGRFLSEMNLFSLAQAGPWDTLNDGDGTYPGRYGTRTAAPKSWPYGRSTNPPGADNELIAPEMITLLGDTDPASPTLGTPGTLSNSLAFELTGAAWNAATPTTYDPDGLARRVSAPKAATAAIEQDRPFGTDETFDLMCRTYISRDGLPSQSRLERLWQGAAFFSTAADSLIWRPLLTTYSWTLNLCPYGVDPYNDQTYRKLDLNTCTAAQFQRVLQSAFANTLYDGSGYDANARSRFIDQFTANFLNFRANRGMTANDLDKYLVRLTKIKGGPNTGITDKVGPPGCFAWDQAAWTNQVPAGFVGNESGYLDSLAAMRTSDYAGYMAALAPIATAVSAVKPAELPSSNAAAWAGRFYGLDRSPFITEVWCNIADAARVDDTNSPLSNNYAVELFNPWGTALNLNNWYLRVLNSPASLSPPIVVSLAGSTIPAGGWLVICRAALGTPGEIVNTNFVVAKQDPNDLNPVVELIYYPGTANLGDPAADADFAVFDNTSNLALASFAGGTPTSTDASRRDDPGSGFWCYQWWETKTPTLGSVNGAPLDATQPWTLATYGPNSAVPITQAGSLLSPADLALIPFGVPRQVHRAGGAETATGQTLADATMGVGAAEAVRFSLQPSVRPALFHRSYNLLSGGNTGTNTPADNQAQLAGIFQTLVDFVTVTDFNQDGVDNDGNGITDYAGGVYDPAELRVPGRFNVNTVSPDQAASLDNDLAAANRRFLLSMGDLPDVAPTTFWNRLLTYRDKRDPLGLLEWYPLATPNSRRANIAGTAIPVRDATTPAEQDGFLGFEQLGELCNVQFNETPTFGGFWRNADTQPRLPQQYIRRFGTNVNMLSVRSDTYMVTLRVEIVRPVYDSAGAWLRNDSFGQREYMYLVDRSYCTQAPQQAPAAGDTFFNARANANFIPPRVWRMSIPSYIAH